ncbi:hypothetical protein [Dictyobacter kobayashii]|uniref:Uncharacterized protein n=1 Tax=Dictyobacter kobayashii TaxID=2014872 RepID=A0A402ARN7_9CHLR|nr:hypothetical protein [Dictyobacter kobayashii]GCE21758.1 hypothetical protein KDK_55580 [Dictyobacter kobayashii]
MYKVLQARQEFIHYQLFFTSTLTYIYQHNQYISGYSIELQLEIMQVDFEELVASGQDAGCGIDGKQVHSLRKTSTISLQQHLSYAEFITF